MAIASPRAVCRSASGIVTPKLTSRYPEFQVEPESVTEGLPEAHATPGFATLAGLCLYAADDPVDIRAMGDRFARTRVVGAPGGAFAVGRLMRALREYF